MPAARARHAGEDEGEKATRARLSDSTDELNARSASALADDGRDGGGVLAADRHARVAGARHGTLARRIDRQIGGFPKQAPSHEYSIRPPADIEPAPIMSAEESLCPIDGDAFWCRRCRLRRLPRLAREPLAEAKAAQITLVVIVAWRLRDVHSDNCAFP